MQPLFIEKTEMLLAGLSFYGDPFAANDAWSEENHIGRVWKRLMACLHRPGLAIPHRCDPGVFYEVHIYGPETSATGQFEVFVGQQVERAEGLPLDLLLKVLPAARYAVFTLRGQEILSDWDNTIDGWLAAAGLERSLPYVIQLYDQRFKGLDRVDESVLDVYLPVRAAG